ncbi:amidase [Verticiella alkaliphila]|uniref:amidase n=1 Tax=Verticiella alkaliphila TaxID=2779529 RepID=UPI00209B8A1D|nr:amidase [Verticiella sp. GG226]
MMTPDKARAANADFPIDDTVGAWVPHGRFVLPGAPQGPLAGLTFAVKDVYDVAGHPTGAGNPAWLATHAVPTRSSPLVDTLREAGATLAGKVLTDELAYSIHGDNVHYGTPINAAAPGRVTGGSSSGSAAAVAARLVDFALGTDTGGSTRVPASYCGLWGLRTTHGSLSQAGLVPLHPSFDTPTWLALDAGTFQQVADVLSPPTDFVPTQAVIVADAAAQADPVFAAPLAAVADAVTKVLGCPVRSAPVANDDLDTWRQTYVTASAFEGWETHGDWIAGHEPGFAAPIAARWAAASAVPADAAAAARTRAAAIRTHVRTWLGADGVAILPSAASLAPARDMDPAAVDAVRIRTLRMTCIAGLAGLPQVSLPLRDADGVPLGISLIGPAGSDRALIALAVRVWQAIAS